MNNDNTTQAAVNKAAEEGGLPEFERRDTMLENLPDLMNEWNEAPRGEAASNVYKRIDGLIEGYVEHRITADRASRQVANKAEVDLSSLSRFGYFATEDGTAMVPDDGGKWVQFDDVAKLFDAPPATTGASTAEHEEILALHRQLAAEKLRADQGWQRAEAKSLECLDLRERMSGSVGASTVLTDERTISTVATEEFYTFHLDVARRAKDGKSTLPSTEKLVAHINQNFACEVAAQAGQVAVPEGFAIVPLEPTDEMKKAAVEDAHLVIKEYWDSKFTGTVTSLNTEMFGQMYKQMLAAAPSPAKESLDPNQVQTIAERLKNTAGLPAKESK